VTSEEMDVVDRIEEASERSEEQKLLEGIVARQHHHSMIETAGDPTSQQQMKYQLLSIHTRGSGKSNKLSNQSMRSETSS